MTLQRSTRVSAQRENVLDVVDRRRLPRMMLDHPVACEVDGEQIEARAKSISGEGMLIETERRLAPGTRLDIRIGPPLTPNRPFHAELLVTRSEELINESGQGGPIEARHRVAGRFTRSGQ